MIRLMIAFAVSALVFSSTNAVYARDLRVLFLGDQGHHQPRARAQQLIPALAEAGIEATYTEDLADVSGDNLKKYDGLIIYANIDVLPIEQESALLEYVANGGGFIPLHCASYCFRNSNAFVELVGAQFQRHGGEEFTTEIVQPEHPIMDGFGGFSSWDETYVHTKHNERNRIVLEVRRTGAQAQGNQVEPWTWVRTHGKGRVFYTAWGHDQRTFSHPGFHNLVTRGIRWACGDDPSEVPHYRDASSFAVPKMTPPRSDVEKFEYVDVGPKIPNYLAGEQWGTQGEIKTLMQKPLAPAESLKHYVVPEGFHLELFVSEPQIQGKPIAMNWDERGRLWICETIDYPNELTQPELGRDRIRICEDTNADGMADKFTVFAEQLSIPTSIEFCRGGVIVQAGVQTLFLRDNDGDDVADQRDVLITGWAMADTHGGVSNFQYGLDNRYWAMQGYNNSQPKFAGGQHPGFRQGPFNFQMTTDNDPQVAAVEFVRSTTNNSWGLGISEEGLIFASTANRAPSFFVPIPNRYYERVRGWTPSLMADEIAPDHLFQPITKNVRQVDHHGGYTAGAGHALYTARNYPEDWWNRVAFVCGPTGHLIGTFVINPAGSSFKDTNTFNLVASDDEWAAPIMAEVGPDGNVWILDWYNYIVQHNPTPNGFERGRGNAYESDLRDKTHGRIYRLVYDGDQGQRQAGVPPMLSPDQPQGLIKALTHSNRLWRRHAQRLLVERGQLDVVGDLLKLVGDQSLDSTGNNVAAIHALWTLHGLHADDAIAGISMSALRHPSAGVRRNALLVLPSRADSVIAIVEAQAANDANAQVQLAALMALADMPVSELAGKYLARFAADEKAQGDQYVQEATICAAAQHAEPFIAALISGGPAESRSMQSAQATILRVVAEHMARSGMSKQESLALLENLSTSDAAWRQPILEGLAAGSREGQTVTLGSAADKSMVLLLEQASAEQLGPLLRLGELWGSSKTAGYAQKLSDELLATIRNGSESDRRRIRSASELIALGRSSEPAVSLLVEQLNPQLPPAVASGIVRALAGSTAGNLAEQLIDLWPAATPTLRADILAVLLARPSGANSILDAIKSGAIAVGELSLDQRLSLSDHPDETIRSEARRLLTEFGGIVDADRQKVIDKFSSAAHQSGNPAKGKLLFVKNCANCHKHSGEGNEIGPDLTGMAVHPKEELLVHILDPSRSVEGNFRRYIILTADGQVLSGMLAAESLAAIELVDAEGKRKSINREDIDEIKSTNLSLMPAGFEEQMSLVDMTDLLEFLTSKGRFVPLPLAKVASKVSTKGMFSNSDNGPDRLIFRQWGMHEFNGIPFQLIDPQGDSRANALVLNAPHPGVTNMPKEVSIPCNMIVQSLHLLSGVSGWGFPYDSRKSTSMIVRFHYEDGTTEDHALINGEHFADYIRRVDVPGSEFAFDLRGQQLRYLSVKPKRNIAIASVDFVKGNDQTAPIVMAVTAERQE